MVIGGTIKTKRGVGGSSRLVRLLFVLICCEGPWRGLSPVIVHDFFNNTRVNGSAKPCRGYAWDGVDAYRYAWGVRGGRGVFSNLVSIQCGGIVTAAAPATRTSFPMAMGSQGGAGGGQGCVATRASSRCRNPSISTCRERERIN